MYNTRVRFACPIYFSRDQSSSKLIIFLDSKLERSNLRVAKIDSRLDSRVEFRNSRVTVNLPLSGTVIENRPQRGHEVNVWKHRSAKPMKVYPATRVLTFSLLVFSYYFHGCLRQQI